MKTAIHLKELDRTTPTGAEQRIYKCDPPLYGHKYVCVSATHIKFNLNPETFIFSCDENGNITEFIELGGLKNEWDHLKALGSAGYSTKLFN